ncbi:cysteine-rich venom protein triflin-like [Littorina saxatilis]|uniref:cysteine-rich venom protein triflin-like n=1 Tax=Littorina saxatilis TaxID=31220 RepID=UPI0038B465F6
MAVSAKDRNLIVDLHNQHRVEANPSASDMLTLKWDKEVAMLAQKWADNCDFKHDGNTARWIPGRFKVGQNLASNQKDWQSAINAWHGEVKDFTYGVENPDLHTVGHYTAVSNQGRGARESYQPGGSQPR